MDLSISDSFSTVPITVHFSMSVHAPANDTRIFSMFGEVGAEPDSVRICLRVILFGVFDVRQTQQSKLMREFQRLVNCECLFLTKFSVNNRNKRITIGKSHKHIKTIPTETVDSAQLIIIVCDASNTLHSTLCCEFQATATLCFVCTIR